MCKAAKLFEGEGVIVFFVVIVVVMVQKESPILLCRLRTKHIRKNKEDLICRTNLRVHKDVMKKVLDTTWETCFLLMAQQILPLPLLTIDWDCQC